MMNLQDSASKLLLMVNRIKANFYAGISTGKVLTLGKMVRFTKVTGSTEKSKDRDTMSKLMENSTKASGRII